jgi:membrane-associated phospholipid phosphatase
LFSCYLFNTNKREFLYFSLTFLLVNIVGFIIYYIVPAAPPWYIQKYGFEFTPLIQGSAAGLLKCDAIIGIPIFQSIYAKGSNVFAAMPSLHSAYPFIVLVFSIRNSLKWMSAFVAVIAVGIWFAAVYTSHHYLLDVLAGITCASFSIILFFHVILKIAFVREGITQWEEAIRKP